MMQKRRGNLPKKSKRANWAVIGQLLSNDWAIQKDMDTNLKSILKWRFQINREVDSKNV